MWIKLYSSGTNPTFKKKGNFFVYGKSGHHAPQCRHSAKIENFPKTKVLELRALNKRGMNCL